jgi:hypothetical protein
VGCAVAMKGHVTQPMGCAVAMKGHVTQPVGCAVATKGHVTRPASQCHWSCSSVVERNPVRCIFTYFVNFSVS